MSAPYAPGPKSPGLMGFMSEFQADFLGLFCRTMNSHGDVVHLRVGPMHVHAVRSPELIAELLLDRASEFVKAPRSNGLIARFLGQSMLTMHGEDARRRRKPGDAVVSSRHRRLRQPDGADRQGRLFHLARGDRLVEAMMQLSMTVITRTVVSLRDTAMQRSIDETMRGIELAFLELLNNSKK